jgi:hybrid polyketide synthase/nonribosomal peptide synthetase ACE1
MEGLMRQPDNDDIRVLPAIPMLHWVGKAKRAGLFEWFLAS